MKAIRIHKHGGVDVLGIDDIPEPSPKEKEVRVRLKATSLNHMDLWMRQGIPGIAKPPIILGCDGSGVVEDVGAKVTAFKTGDRVFFYSLLGCGDCPACQKNLINECLKARMLGEHTDGTHREFICLPQKNVIKLDDCISHEEAAAFPLVFLTAWHMLTAKAGVKSGETVLVIGAASGVGSAAVQIAKLLGATVIATAGSAEKCALAKKIGADFVIDHYKEGISAKVKEFTDKKGANVIVEHVGEKVWTECLKSLAWHGRLVTCGATTGPLVNLDLRHVFIKQQRIIGSTMGTPDELAEIHRNIASKKLTPVIAKVFPFQQIKEAHQFLERSSHFGKVIIKW